MNNTQDQLRESVRKERDRAKQWLLLKPTIMQLLARDGRDRKSHSEVVKFLKEHYDFNAFGIHQLKYQLQLWNAGTNLPARVKKTICKAVQKRRAKLNKSSVAIYRGQKVDPGKLRRWLQQDQANPRAVLQPAGSDSGHNRRPISGQELQLGYKIFMNLNLPIGILRSLVTMHLDYTSPAGSAISPMSDLVVETPNSYVNRPLPRDAGSPMAIFAKIISSNERASLFVEGRQFDLLRSMSAKEQWTTASWTYELWQYFFKTAKHWGRGPVDWTVNNLGLENLYDRVTVSLPNTPSPNVQSRSYQEIPNVTAICPPTLCRWSIHIRICEEYIPSEHDRFVVSVEEPDPKDERSWAEWPTSLRNRSYTEVIQGGLEANTFTRIKMHDLPIGLTQIVEAVKRSPNELLEEAFGFSIMGRNLELINEMIYKIKARQESESPINLDRVHPFHLATTYLDGSKQCCNILDELVSAEPPMISIRKLYWNDLGHTVLDNLMITILRSHTSCSANVVDNAFTKNHRFAGEEIDICGRWDADSDCIRQLLASGNPTVPFEWKHMFCHTSAQTICHSIAAVFGPHWGPDINAPSGLFIQRCSNPECGEKLVLYPLHTLVLTAVHLSESGCQNENLFGVLACLLCLLSNGANPLLKAQVSPEALLGQQLTEDCTHEALDPLELANRIPEDIKFKWSTEVQTGWRILCSVLRDSQTEWRPKAPRQAPDAGQMQYMYDVHSMDHTSVLTLPSICGMDDDYLYKDIEMADAPFLSNAVWDAGDEQSNMNSMDMRDAQEDESSGEAGSLAERLPAKCNLDFMGWHRNYFGESKRLATLWAAVQAELVTYRRLEEGDSWISPYFNMQTLLQDLGDPNGEHLSIDLVRRGMIKEFCDCGIYYNADDHASVRMEEVSSDYFSNVEDCDWKRRNYIYAHGFRSEDWCVEW